MGGGVFIGYRLVMLTVFTEMANSERSVCLIPPQAGHIPYEHCNLNYNRLLPF